MPGYPRPRAVAPVPLGDLAARLGAARGSVRPAGGGAGVGAAPASALPAVTGVTHASTEVRPGDLYAALPGAHRHGAEFVADAARAGATAVLTDACGAAAAAGAGLPALVVPDPRAVLGTVAAHVYGDPTARLAVIGVTGTAGKTSTTYLIESGLRAGGYRTGLIGTVETRLGDDVLDSVRTTPEATDLQSLFAAALDRGVTAIAMEVSSHALAMGRVTGTRFAVGGFTNFGLDHLDFHADVEEYFAAKALLFDGRCAVEVVNLDEPALRGLVRQPAAGEPAAGDAAVRPTVTYSAAGGEGATWRAVDVLDDGYGQRFTALGPRGVVVDCAVALPGRHNVANALLALASLTALGVDPGVAAKGIAACPGVPGRMERVPGPGPVIGVVDYAHKPDAIVAVLRALRQVSAGRLICVLGAGGDRDRGKRPLMGAAAAAGADLVVVTDDNPRAEDPASIRADVLSGVAGGRPPPVDRRPAGPRPATVGHAMVEVAGRRAAIAEAVRLAEPGDVVAVLGKGHERGQEVAGTVHPFDDRVELAAALRARFQAGQS